MKLCSLSGIMSTQLKGCHFLAHRFFMFLADSRFVGDILSPRGSVRNSARQLARDVRPVQRHVFYDEFAVTWAVVNGTQVPSHCSGVCFHGTTTNARSPDSAFGIKLIYIGLVFVDLGVQVHEICY